LTLPGMGLSTTSFAPRRNLAWLSALLLCGTLVLAGCGGSDPKDQEPPQNTSSRVNPLASLFRVNVGIVPAGKSTTTAQYDCWLAATPSERTEGLSYVTSLEMPPRLHKGMVFVYPHNQFVGFWGKDTFVTLDVVFAVGTSEGIGKIVQIEKGGIVPYQRTILSSNQPVQYVLEVPHGDLANIQVGDKILVPVNTPSN